MKKKDLKMKTKSSGNTASKMRNKNKLTQTAKKSFTKTDNAFFDDCIILTPEMFPKNSPGRHLQNSGSPISPMNIDFPKWMLTGRKKW